MADGFERQQRIKEAMAQVPFDMRPQRLDQLPGNAVTGDLVELPEGGIYLRTPDEWTLIGSVPLNAK